MSGASRARRFLPKALLALLALALAGVLLALWSGPADAQTTFTVNRTGDASDRNINNSVCDASSKRGNQCTLRAAIEEANNTPGADTINFNIGGTTSVKTIKPAKQLPEITEAVTINGYSQPGASENTLEEGNDAVLKIQLNGIDAGLDANGLVIETSDSTIKGLVVNRFTGNGVLISGSGATGNEILGNFIGTNAAGTADLGNSRSGVGIGSASDNIVGGTASQARNVISGNETGGVAISASSSNGNEVLGNFIGTDVGGTADLGNGDEGVDIFNGDGVQIFNAPNNTVGGTASGAGNVIAHNEGDGVLVAGGAAGVGNRVLSNSIFSNGELGIDLINDGVTANDDVDPDTGPNNLQNFPVITSATQAPVQLGAVQFFEVTIEGTLNSTTSEDFTVQCFLTGAPDGSGHGEGQAFTAEDTTVTIDPTNGNASFECKFLFIASLEGENVSATATNQATGDTSEFSANVGITPGS